MSDTKNVLQLLKKMKSLLSDDDNAQKIEKSNSKIIVQLHADKLPEKVSNQVASCMALINFGVNNNNLKFTKKEYKKLYKLVVNIQKSKDE